MIAERIKLLRESQHMTQAELAKKLGITRSGVNAWEQGISVPSTQYIIQLAHLFHASADFLLGIEQNATLDISGLSEEDCAVVQRLVAHLRAIRNQKDPH